MWTAQLGPQAEAICATWCDELFFGGARGGGKSDYLLADFLQSVPKYGLAWQGVLFRRTYPELQELIKRSQAMYTPTGAKWLEQAKEWHWPNGSCLRMRYLEHPRDASRYQGHEYTWIGWDELTQWASDEAYNLLKACLRSSHGVDRKRIRSSGNPGGPGHHWVKAYFIDHAPKGFEPVFDDATKMRRMFIPSRVQDNRALLYNDPGYVDRLKGVGSPEMVRAWLEGDWNVVTGAFFPEFGNQHIIKPCTIPKHWTRFRSMDWGSAKPFVCQWWAVSDGEETEQGRIYPKNALIMYREWYGGKNNVGLKLNTEAIAAGILARQLPGEEFAYSIIDSQAYVQDGGPSNAEKMASYGVFFRSAGKEKERKAGWQQLRDRLVGHDERPMLYVFDTCRDFIRTLPSLQHDEADPEDVNTEGDDHSPDAARMACMSRPYARPREIIEPPKTIHELTLSELLKRHRERDNGW